MKQYIERSMSAVEYTSLLDSLLTEGKTTGDNQSEAMLDYARINRQRMKRLDKTIELGEGVRKAARSLERRLVWLILTEGWCGDAAQNLPAIEKIAAESVNIETRYLLRDENLELMDQFLTGGSRSIPKLIAIDAETEEVLGSWGARPEAAQILFLEMKDRGLEKPLMLENMQRWYNTDKTLSIQSEFEILLTEWNRGNTSAAGA